MGDPDWNKENLAQVKFDEDFWIKCAIGAVLLIIVLIITKICTAYCNSLPSNAVKDEDLKIKKHKIDNADLEKNSGKQNGEENGQEQ